MLPAAQEKIRFMDLRNVSNTPLLAGIDGGWILNNGKWAQPLEMGGFGK